jgi:aryl-alcohol dehydrogenase-like predicted oxidoreductase
MSNIEKAAAVKKIVLGTVQFGLDYGISNQDGQTSSTEVQAILKEASNVGITFLDTAHVYGNSEKVLGDCELASQFQIISKFPRLQTDRTLESYLIESLSLLKRDSLYGYLAHDADSINEPHIWSELLRLREKKLVRKIGFSLYTREQLRKLLDKNFIPDIVQVPYNLFDRRFEEEFKMLKTLGVEIHIRSVFLQGLFFLEPDLLSAHFNKAKPMLEKLRKTFNDKALAGYLLNFCFKNPSVDKIVIGVNQASQLASNISQLNSSFPDLDWSEFQLSDESILLPYNWPKI